MGNFVTEEQIQLYKTFVAGIRDDLGRNVTIHVQGPKIACPNCLIDTINKKSTGIYSPRTPYPADIPGPTPFKGGVCPVCNGSGQYTTETVKIVKCLIRWLKADEREWGVQGMLDHNDFRLKADIKYMPDFQKARVVVIDGISCQVTSTVQRGLRDLIQVVVFLKSSSPPEGRIADVSKY